MKILICGGRDYKDYEFMERTLDLIFHNRFTELTLVHGAAPGADTFADHWAAERFIERKPYPANWIAHGSAAGLVRNQQMLISEQPDLVIAFRGGAGTRDMVERARQAGVPALQVIGGK